MLWRVISSRVVRSSASGSADSLLGLSSRSFGCRTARSVGELLLPFNWKKWTQHFPQFSVRQPKRRSQDPQRVPAQTAPAPPPTCQNLVKTEAGRVGSFWWRRTEQRNIVRIFNIRSRRSPLPARHTYTANSKPWLTDRSQRIGLLNKCKLRLAIAPFIIKPAPRTRSAPDYQISTQISTQHG